MNRKGLIKYWMPVLYFFTVYFEMICDKTTIINMPLLCCAALPAARGVTGLVGPWATQIISFISDAAKTNLRAD